MNTNKIVIVLLTYLINSVASDDALCYNSKTAVNECCHDYKNVSGTCEGSQKQMKGWQLYNIACIGFWGKECSYSCSYGYYGHGCRTMCNCNYQQICDPIQGCIADYSIDDTSKYTNCSYVEKVYNILTSAYGINICYNSTTENIECCAGFTNRTGICEKNVESSTEKVEFTTNNADVPQTPMVFPYATGYVNMTWISGFKGGYEQFFILSLVEASNLKVIGNITDPQEGKLAHFDPGYLTPGQDYRFRIKSCNVVNCSEHSAEFELTIKGYSRDCFEERQEELFGGYAIIAFCVLAVLLGSTWLIVAVFVIYKYRRGNLQQSNTRDTHDIRLETQSFTQNYEVAQFTDAWDMYTELDNPYQGTPETMYEEPKM